MASTSFFPFPIFFQQYQYISKLTTNITTNFFFKFPTMRRTSTSTTNSVLVMLDLNVTQREIAKSLHISVGTVANIKKRFRPESIGQPRGRKPKLSARLRRDIIKNVTTGTVDTAVQAAKRLEEDHQLRVNPETVRRSLKEAGMKSGPKIKKPLLRPKHIQDRLNFAKKYQEWTVEDWKRVIWSDETKVNRFGSDGRKWCWKQVKTGIQDRQVQKTIKHGGGSIMIWGCMTAQGPGFLSKIDGGLDAALYCNILDDELVNTMEWYGLDVEDTIFQHDNDPKHTAKATSKWLQEHHIRVLDWPAQSPDLNPIEHLWEHLKRRLSAYDSAPTGVHQLWDRVQHEWELITAEDCMRLIESMPRRIEAVLKAKGKYTKY